MRWQPIAHCVLVALLAACTRGSLSKVEYFAEYPPTAAKERKPNYYRVSINGEGFNGKVDYRAGWYDARAVDSLFSTLSEEQSSKATTAARQKKAIRKTHDLYMDALEADTVSQADIETRRKNYKEAVSGVSGVTSAGNERTSPLDKADQKFVMIFSNDPSRVIEAINGRVQQMQITETIGAVLRQKENRDRAVNRDRLNILIAEANALKTSAKEVGDKLTGTAKENDLYQYVVRLLTETEGVR